MVREGQVAVLGVGMHPWGKWGRNFVEYGVAAASDALADAGVDVDATSQFVSGADTMRNGYPGYVAGATFAQALGWTGRRVASSYAACASGATGARGRPHPRSSPGCCDVALVVGADTTRRASSRRTPASGPTIPTGCASACSAPRTRPTSRSTPAAAWICTAPPTTTSPR